MNFKGLDIAGEIVKTEVKHIDVGTPPTRFLALRLTTEIQNGTQVQGEWAVLAVPLGQQFVAALRTSLENPPQSETWTTQIH